VNAGPYELGMTRPARRAISELLPEDVAAAAVELIRSILSRFHSARLGTQRRVLYRIDESKHTVIVQDIQHRSVSYRRR
jgi:mRNA interferase RelE/StbE